MKNKLLLLAFIFIASAQVSFAQVPSYVPTNGLVGWWPFNGNANDESGNGNNGTALGALLSADRYGQTGKAYLFNGGSNRITVPNNSSFSMLDFTISFWMKSSYSGTHEVGLISKNIASGYPAYWVYLNHGGFGLVDLYVTQLGGAQASVTSPTILNDGNWHAVTVTRTGNNGNQSIYVDGIISNTGIGPTGTLSVPDELLFGETFNGDNQSNYEGKLDDIALWNRALSTTEVQQLYQSQSPCSLTANFFLQDTISVCGSSVSLDALNPGSTYNWNTGATTQTISVTSTGWYRCVVTQGGCSVTDSLFVSLVNAEISINDTAICTGSTLTLRSSNYQNTSQNCFSLTQNLQQGLVAYYPFCGNANNIVNSSHQGTVVNTLLTADRNGNTNSAYQFNGINSCIQIPYSPALSPTSGTVAVWVKVNGNFNNLQQLLFAQSGGRPSLYANGSYRCGILRTAGNSWRTNTSTGPNDFATVCGTSFLDNGMWHLVVGTYTPNNLSVFVDGNLEASTTTSLIQNQSIQLPFYIGGFGQSDGNYQYFNGTLDDIGIWNRVLSQNEISTLYQGSNYLWSTGATTPSITFNPAQTTTYYLTVSNGISSCTDSVRVTVNQPTSGSQTINACSSYTWQGTTYTQGGTYTKTLTNAAGCDSTATLNLTISQLSSGSSSVTACGSYTWQGTTYTQSGTYTRALTNAAGCDSTATLILTINQPSSGSSSVTACGSYTWQGTTYTQGGTYTRTLTNAVGCDSTATLILTISQPSSGSSSETACGSYTWQGTTYTQGGTYTRTLTNTAGCDSTATLILTINQPSSGSSSVTACGSYTWQGTTYTQGGTYTRTLTNVAGCDSVATLNLTIQSASTPTIQITSSASGPIAPGTSITFTATIASGGSSPVYQWKKNGSNVGTNSSTYTDTQWTDGDIVTCTLTSNATCITTSTVTSNSITVQVISPNAIARFLVVDVFQNRACYYDSLFNFVTSNILSTNVLYATTNVSDVVATPTRVYVLDGVNSVVYQSSASNTVAVRSKTLRTNSGGKLSGPTGLTISGDTLWVLDPKNNFIYRYSLASIFSGSGTVNAQVKMTLSNTNSKGEALWNDAGNLYVLDNGTSKTIYRYRKSGGTPAISKVLRTANGGTLSAVTGMTVRNGIVYVTDRTQDKVYPYPLSSLYTGTGTLNASAIYQLNLINLDPTGITVVSNTSTARVVDETPITTGPSALPETSSLHPNPANGDVVIRYTASQSGISYAAIYSLNGQLVYQTEKTPYEQGENELALPIAAEPLPNGVYFVRLICSDRVDDLRLIIAR